MNGRIYDPTLGRFLQADPFIQAPGNSQSYNRYSYVLNNPMSYTDPSGYLWNPLKKIGRNIIRGAAKIFGAEVVAIAGNIASMFCGPAAAACAGAWNYEFARAMGASSSGALRGAFTAAASVYAFQQIGGHFKGISGGTGANINFGGNVLTAGQVAQQIAAHALVGGVSSVLQGGKFGHGFFSAGVTKGFGGAFLPGGSDLSGGDIAKGTVVSMVIGGTASVISGGKFANGARTAAMQYLFNQAGKKPRRGGGRPQLTPEQKELMRKRAGLYNFWKTNGDLSVEATACYGPCISVEGEYTNQYGLSGSGALASEWGYGAVFGGGADFELFTSQDVNIVDGTWTPTRSVGGQFGFIGITTTRYESLNGHLTTNIEVNFRFPGGFSVHGGGGIKKW